MRKRDSQIYDMDELKLSICTHYSEANACRFNDTNADWKQYQ